MENRFFCVCVIGLTVQHFCNRAGQGYFDCLRFRLSKEDSNGCTICKVLYGPLNQCHIVVSRANTQQTLRTFLTFQHCQGGTTHRFQDFRVLYASSLD